MLREDDGGGLVQSPYGSWVHPADVEPCQHTASAGDREDLPAWRVGWDWRRSFALLRELEGWR